MARQRKLPAGMQLRGKVYYSCFRANGRQVRMRLSSDFDAACRILNSLRAKADQADFGMVDNNVSLKALREKFDRHCRLTLRASTRKRYGESLDRLFRSLPVTRVAQLTESLINEFREGRLLEVSTRTVNIDVGALQIMLNWAASQGNALIASNPIAHVRRLPTAGKERKRRRSLTVEEIEELFRVSPEYLRPVWRMLITTGMRRGEVSRLRFADIDFERGVVTIGAAHAKGKKEREVPLDEAMLDIIKRLRDDAPFRRPGQGTTPEQTADIARRFSKEHVFVTTVGTPYDGTLLAKFYVCCRRAKIADAATGGSVDIHSLRVSFATLSIEHGASPKAVQEILGHATLAMTMGVYSKATDRAKRAAVSALPFAKAAQPTHLVPLQTEHTLHTIDSGAMQVVG